MSSSTTTTPSQNDINEQYKVILGTVFGVIIANTAVALRLLARKAGHIKLRLDDYLICCALLFHWGIAIAGIFLLNYGIGLPVTSPSFQPVSYAKVLLTGTFLYSVTIFFTKTSILYLYHRAFPLRAVRLAVYAVGFTVLVWTIVCCTAGAVVCVPLQKLWNPTLAGSCFNLSKFYVGIQIPNVITDVAIFVIPLPVIRTLPLPQHERWSLVGIFGVGLLTVIFDIIRLAVMVRLSTSTQDITLAQVDGSVWTCVEPAIGILAGCLSNMRPLLKYFRSSHHSELYEETTEGSDAIHLDKGSGGQSFANSDAGRETLQ